MGRLGDCRTVLEAPDGRGFGDAARNIAGLYQIDRRLPTGAPTAGARVEVPVQFDWRGRAGDPRISGAPEAGPDSAFRANPAASVAAGLVGAAAFLAGIIVLLLRDWRQRDRSSSVRAALGEAWAFLPGYIRRAPVPVALAVLGGVFAFPFGPFGDLSRSGLSLLASVTGLFAMAAAYRLFYSDRGGRFPAAPGVGGLEFGVAEGAMWMAALLGGLTAIVVASALVLLAFVGARLAVPAGEFIVAPLFGLGLAAFLVLFGRITFLAPISVFRRSLDVRGAWDFGAGRIASILAIHLAGAALLLPPALIAGAIGGLTQVWWLAGLVFGAGYAVYYGFAAAALASLVAQAQRSHGGEAQPNPAA